MACVKGFVVSFVLYFLCKGSAASCKVITREKKEGVRLKWQIETGRPLGIALRGSYRNLANTNRSGEEQER